MPTPEAREEELYFLGALIFDALPDPHLIVDQHLLIRHLNQAACEGFGYRRDELENQAIELLIPELLREQHQKYMEAYMQDPLARPMGVGLVVKARRKSGKEVACEIELRPLVRSHKTQRRIIVRVRFKHKLEDAEPAP